MRNNLYIVRDSKHFPVSGQPVNIVGIISHLVLASTAHLYHYLVKARIVSTLHISRRSLLWASDCAFYTVVHRQPFHPVGSPKYVLICWLSPGTEKTVYFLLHSFMWCMFICMGPMAWMSEVREEFCGSAVSSPIVSSGEWTQAVSLGSKHLDLLSRLLDKNQKFELIVFGIKQSVIQFYSSWWIP